MNTIKRLKQWRKERPWYSSYSCAKSRCLDKNNPAYKYYGGIGLKFLMTLPDFEYLWNRDKAWLLKRPSIDRKNNKKGYIKSNCRFIELQENCLEGVSSKSPKKLRAILKNGFATRFKKGNTPWIKGKHLKCMQGKNHPMYGVHLIPHNKGKKLINGKYI